MNLLLAEMKITKIDITAKINDDISSIATKNAIMAAFRKANPKITDDQAQLLSGAVSRSNNLIYNQHVTVSVLIYMDADTYAYRNINVFEKPDIFLDYKRAVTTSMKIVNLYLTVPKSTDSNVNNPETHKAIKFALQKANSKLTDDD